MLGAHHRNCKIRYQPLLDASNPLQVILRTVTAEQVVVVVVAVLLVDTRFSSSFLTLPGTHNVGGSDTKPALSTKLSWPMSSLTRSPVTAVETD